MKILSSMLLFFSMYCSNALDLKPYKKIVCLGDSITHSGEFHGFLQQYLAETDPGHPRKVVNCGIGGNTVTDLLDRVHTVLEKEKPDLVFIMIGINDLMFTTSFPEKDLSFETAVKKYPVFQRFEKGLGELLDILKKANIPAVLLATPPYNESAHPEMKSKVNANMNSSGVKNLLILEKRLAKEKGAVWIDIYTPLLKNLQKNDGEFPRGKSDRVHPSRQEHLLIAQTILGKKYTPGPSKALEEYLNAQKQIQGIALLLSRFPKDCTTPEARIAYQKKWVSTLKGIDYEYHSRALKANIATLKDPESRIRAYEKRREEAYRKLYKMK